jgi:hypothetical protein
MCIDLCIVEDLKIWVKKWLMCERNELSRVQIPVYTDGQYVSRLSRRRVTYTVLVKDQSSRG